MSQSITNKFPTKEIHVDAEGLKALEAQFKGLGEKVKAGDYVVTAKEVSSPGDGHGTVDSVLDIVIKPSVDNRISSIESMTFKFVDDGYNQITRVTFKIKTTDRKSLTGSHQGGVHGFLDDMRKIGREKIAADRCAPAKAAIDVIKSIKL